MKTGLKVFLGFTVGLSVGTIGTGIGLKKYYEKQIKEEIIPEIKESYEERISALEEEAKKYKEARKAYEQYISGKKNENNTKTVKKSTKSNEKVKVEKGKVAKEKLDTNKTDYTKHYKPIDVDDEERIKFDVKPRKTNGLKVDKDGHVYSKVASHGNPCIISLDEYTDLNGYEKMTYTFWAYDEVFTDETEEPDLNVVMYIGHDLMDLWEEYSEDHESLFIRNENQHTDYEIIVREQSYADYMREPDDI